MFVKIGLVVALVALPNTLFANPIVAERKPTTTSIQFTNSKQMISRAAPSSYPYGAALPNEFQWRNWDLNDADQKKSAQRIHQAFTEWQDFAKAGLEAASNISSPTFIRWFGNPEKGTDDSQIEKVFANAYDASTGTATANVAKMICDYKDFGNACKEGVAAYTISETGEFHVCQYGLDRKLNAELDCTKFDESCSAAMRSLPMTFMNEMTLFNSIGEDARGGFGIGDEGKGAYECFSLIKEDKVNNAQNYAWFAGEAYWSKQCSKTFKDPDPGVRSTGEDETIESTTGPDQPSCMGQVQFHQEEADAAIVKFCGNLDWKGTVVVPQVSIGSQMTSDGRHKSYQIQAHFPVNNGADNLWLDIYFAQDSCIGSFEFDQNQCLTHMRSVLNGCNTAGLFPKYGGLIRDSCAVYRISASATGNPDPTFLLSNYPKILGDFTCTDTDVSVLGPSSPLAGTCTCWYSGVQSVTDVFDRPAGGCSAVESSSNPKTN